MIVRRGALRLAVVAGIAAVLLPSSRVPAQAAGSTTLTFQQGLGAYAGTQDTFLLNTSPATAQGASSLITIGRDHPESGGTEQQGLLRFDGIFGNGAGQIPSGTTIQSATLTMYMGNNARLDSPLYLMLVDWSGASATWNSLVSGIQLGTDASSTIAATYPLSSATVGFYTIDVTSSVQAWSNGQANRGWAILANPALNGGGNDSGWVASSEAATAGQRPKLTITFESPTVTPTPTVTATPTVTPTPTPLPGGCQKTGNTIHCPAQADARTSSGSPSSNFGSSTYLRVRGPSPSYRSYLKFQVGGITSAVQSAKVRLYAYDGSTQAGSIHSVSNSWLENTVTWSSQPPLSGSALATLGAVPDNTWAEYPVTGAVAADGVYSFSLSSTSSSSPYFHSRESASANKPEIVITLAP